MMTKIFDNIHTVFNGLFTVSIIYNRDAMNYSQSSVRLNPNLFNIFTGNKGNQ